MTKQLEKHCVRCNCTITKESGIVRKVCSTCDLILQTMHHSIEWKLFGKLTYMLPDEEPSVKWFTDHEEKIFRDAIHKNREPQWRSWFKIPKEVTHADGPKVQA